MKKTNKILAASSIFVSLAVIGGSLALLGDSGVLFSLGSSIIVPTLIAVAGLFATLSLISSISFLRYRKLEKKNLKESSEEKKTKKEELEQDGITDEQVREEQKKVRGLNEAEKEDYFKEAIKKFNQPAIRLIVNEKDAFKEILHKNYDLVYYAAKEGGDGVVKYIQTLGVNINYPFNISSRYSAVYYAITLNDTETLKRLLDNGADPTKIRHNLGRGIEDSGKTPLMEAAGRLQTESVKLLLSREEVKANINAQNWLKKTALAEVFNQDKVLTEEKKQAQYEIVELLLESGADHKKALEIARKNNCDNDVILLLERAGDKGDITEEQVIEEKERVKGFSEEDKEDYFKEAIREFKKLKIRVIFSENGDLFKEIAPENGGGLVYYAFKEGSDSLAKYMVEDLGIDINEPFGDSDRLPILSAIVDEGIEGLSRLVNNGANPNMLLLGEIPPLTMAAGYFHKAQVEYLLNIKEVRENINVKTSVGDTALIKVLKESGEGYTEALQYKIVELLLENGADPIMKNKEDKTALDIAKENHSAKGVISLLETAEKQAEKQLIEEKERVRGFSEGEKEDYFKEAIREFKKLNIRVIFSENGELFKELMPKYQDFIYYAFKEGSDGLVKYMVEDLGVDLNERFAGSQYYPILCAISLGDVETLRRLLNNGAKPAKIQYRGGRMQPLIMAATFLDKVQVECLLSIKEVRDNINSRFFGGNTALTQVLKKNKKDSRDGSQYDIVDLLLKNGINPTIKNDEGQTALDIAKENNSNEEVISLLETVEKKVKEQAKEQVEGKELFIKGQEDITEAQVKEEQARVRSFSKEEKIDYFKEATLYLKKLDLKVIFSENGELFEEILPKNGGDLLYYAAKKGGNRVVKYIVEDLEIDLNKPFGNNEYPTILCAVVSQNTEVLRFLVNNGADPNISLGSITPLAMAASFLEQAQVEYLLTIDKVRANINAKSSEGSTALIKTFKKKCEDSSKELQYNIVSLLLENGADPIIKNNKSKTALDIAKENNSDEKVILLLKTAEEQAEKQLIEEQAKVRNLSKEEKVIYFEEAIRDFKRLNIRVIFSENGELFKELTPKYKNLVYYAFKEGSDSLIKYIVEDLEVDINKTFGDSVFPPILCSIVLSNIEILRRLVDNRAEPVKIRSNNREMPPLVMAASFLEQAQVEYLLTIDKVRANINALNALGNTALIEVSQLSPATVKKQKQYDIVSLLLEKGADPTIRNNRSKTALDLVRDRDCDQRVISLLETAEEQAKVRDLSEGEKEDYFKEAIREFKKLNLRVIFSENGELFKELMSKYSDFIYYTVREGSDIAVKYIVEDLGVNINEPFGDSKLPPIHHAIIEGGSIEELSRLVENGADPNIPLLGKMTPLAAAVVYSQKTQVEYLLGIDIVRANINAQNMLKNTALMEVFNQVNESCSLEGLQEQYDIARLLLENRADPTIRNYKNKTALDLAKDGGYEDKFILLLEEAEEKWKKGYEENYVDRVQKSNPSQVHQK